MNRLLVFGAGGQVGRELSAAAAPPGWTVVGCDHEAVDIADAGTVAHCVTDMRPAAVVNAAAYTAVDRAESERESAFLVNETGARNVAAACAAARVPLIHLSTDYVFDGTKRDAYAEDDTTRPLSVYGASKEAGERAVRATQPAHIILRTSWVFAAHGANFVRTMLRLGAERTELRIVDDQRGGPTAALDIAGACLGLAAAIVGEPARWGTYHYVGTPVTTWHDFAAAIFAAVAGHRGPSPRLTRIATSEYKTAARRPMNSALDCGKIAREFGITQPDWRPALADVVARLLSAPEGKR
jgi:dTDP-4-dehydrorhamnose reductase